MAYCKHCNKEVEPVKIGNRFRCPDCNLYVKATEQEKSEPVVEIEKVPDEELEEVSEENTEKGPDVRSQVAKIEQDTLKKILPTTKTVKYDAADLHMGEILINIGFAKDLNDLTRKNMKLAYSLLNMGALGKQVNSMELNKEPNLEMTTKEPDPGRALKAIQEGDLYQAQIDKLKKSGSGDNTVELMDRALKQQMLQAQIDGMKGRGNSDPLTTMMMMRYLDADGKGKDVGENNFMDKMMQIQMMNAMKPQADVGLQKEIADLKHQMQMQQLLSQNQQTQQGQTSSQEFMQQMEAVRAERDQSIKAAEISAQQERDKNLQLAYDNRRIELESRVKSMEKEIKEKGSGQFASERIKNMKEEIAAVKEMSVILGDKEKGTGEMIMESLGTVAEKAGPAIAELLKAKREQPPRPQQPQEFPQELPPESNPESANPTPSEMTEEQQQMSDTMSDMYIKKRKG